MYKTNGDELMAGQASYSSCGGYINHAITNPLQSDIGMVVRHFCLHPNNYANHKTHII